MNSGGSALHPDQVSFLTDSLSGIVIDVPVFCEVMETLDVFQKTTIRGRVLDSLGLPVSGALVEMWYSQQWGMYGMEYGLSYAPNDPDDQAWASVITDENGYYSFDTENRAGQPGRCAEAINFKVTDENGSVVLTKLYLNEDPSNPSDPFLMDMEIEERIQYTGREENGVCEFDILL